MGMPPAKMGLVYPWKGLRRFVQTLGCGVTKEMFFTGRTYEGVQLKAKGLVNFLVPREQLESFTMTLAREIAGNAPLSLKGTKRVLNLMAGTLRMGHEEIAEAERLMVEAFGSEDLKEGQRAFLLKRKPDFRGR